MRSRRVGALLGAPPLPWQRLVMDTALEVDPDGRPAYREVRVTVPRQQGKTGGLLLPVMVHRALGGVDPRPQRILYTAQDRNHAREKWSEQVELLDRSPVRRLYTVRRSNGSEAIRWRTGSTHQDHGIGRKVRPRVHPRPRGDRRGVRADRRPARSGVPAGHADAAVGAVVGRVDRGDRRERVPPRAGRGRSRPGRGRRPGRRRVFRVVGARRRRPRRPGDVARGDAGARRC